MASRRKLLASLGVSASALGGCMCVSATSIIPFDDVLRVFVDSIEHASDRYVTTVRVAQPDESWTYEFDNERPYETSYEDVALDLLALDGTELTTVQVDDLEPGYVVEQTVETARFPDVIRGSVGTVETNYGECTHADLGIQTVGYVGHHETSETLPEWPDHHQERRGELPIDRSGHRWFTLDYEDPRIDRSQVYSPFERTFCRQRLVAAQDVEHEFFGLIDGRSEQLRPGQSYRFIAPRFLSEEWRSDSRTIQLADVPEDVLDPEPPVHWAPNEIRTEAELSRQEFLELLRQFENDPELSLPVLDPNERLPHWEIKGGERFCKEGTFIARYEVVADGDSFGIALEYDGVTIASRATSIEIR